MLAVRRERQDSVRRLLATITDARLAEPVCARGDGWPPAGLEHSVGECLRVVLDEEWQRRLFAERDLTVLERQVGRVEREQDQ